MVKVIKTDSETVKVIGGGTQDYNKNNIDRRRPLIMRSPTTLQKAAKRAKDPIYKDLLKEIEEYKEEIVKLEKAIDTLEEAHGVEVATLQAAIVDTEKAKEDELFSLSNTLTDLKKELANKTTPVVNKTKKLPKAAPKKKA